MSDNTELNLGAGGDTIQTVDNGAYKTQVVSISNSTGANKLAVTAAGLMPTTTYDGSGSAINSLSAGTGLNGLISAAGATAFFYSVNNTSVAQLGAGATFTGTIETVQSQPAISICMSANQQITLVVKQYVDSGGTKLIDSWTYVVAANAGLNISRIINGNFIQVTATNNGGSTTTTFNLNVAYGQIAAATQLGNTPLGLNEVNGSAISLGQNTMANSLPVVLSSNQASIPVTLASTTVTGTVSNVALPTNSAAVSLVSVNINATGALTQLKATAGNLYGFSIINNTAAVAYLSFWNLLSASVTLGTTAPTCVFVLPASGTLTVNSLYGLMATSTGISFASVTAYNGSTAASVTGSIFYK